MKSIEDLFRSKPSAWSDIMRKDPARFRAELIVFACDRSRPWPDRSKAFRILEACAEMLGIIREPSAANAFISMARTEFPSGRLDLLFRRKEPEDQSDGSELFLLLNLLITLEKIDPHSAAKEIESIEATLNRSDIAESAEKILRYIRNERNGGE